MKKETKLKNKDDRKRIKHSCDYCNNHTECSFLFKKWGYSILMCNICSLVFMDQSHINDISIQNIYNKDYFEGNKKDGYSGYEKSEPVLKKEFSKLLDYLARYNINSGKLLEIGCAYGYFLDVASMRFEVSGIEISKHAHQICLEKKLDVTLSDNLSTHIEMNQKKELVVLLDCIEHLKNPDNMIFQANQVLKKNGHIIITTGDYDSILARLMGKHWRLLTPPQHLFYFSKKTITNYLFKHNFEVLDISHPTKLVPIDLLCYQLKNRYDINLKLSKKIKSLGIPVKTGDAMRILAKKTIDYE